MPDAVGTDQPRGERSRTGTLSLGVVPDCLVRVGGRLMGSPACQKWTRSTLALVSGHSGSRDGPKLGMHEAPPARRKRKRASHQALRATFRLVAGGAGAGDAAHVVPLAVLMGGQIDAFKRVSSLLATLDGIEAGLCGAPAGSQRRTAEVVGSGPKRHGYARAPSNRYRGESGGSRRRRIRPLYKLLTGSWQSAF